MPVQNDDASASHDGRALSRSLSASSVLLPSASKKEGSKKKRWSLNPFKRKDKNRKRDSKVEANAAHLAQIEPQESVPGTGSEEVNVISRSLKSLPSSESSLVSGRSSFEDTRRQSIDYVTLMLDKASSTPSTPSDVRLSDGYTGSEDTGRHSVGTSISEREHVQSIGEDEMENVSEQHESGSDLSALSSRRNSLDIMRVSYTCLLLSSDV